MEKRDLGGILEVLPVEGRDTLAWWWHSIRHSGFCRPNSPQSSDPSVVWVSVLLDNLST